MQSVIIEGAQTDSYKNFINSLDSQASRKTYRNSLAHFMRFCQIDNYCKMLQIQPISRLEGLIRDFIIHLREDKKISQSTIATYSAAIAHLRDE